MNRFNSVIGAALLAAFAWLGVATPTLAQGSYGKVEQPWYMQGKISGGISVTSSSAPTQLPGAGQIAAICNTGAVDVSLGFGVDNTVTVALAAGTSLKAGSCRAYDLLPFSTLFKWVAAISASSSTLTVETGIGTPNFSGNSVVSGTVTIAGNSGNVAQTAVSVTNASTTLAAAAAFANFAKICVALGASTGIWVNWAGSAAVTAAPSEYIPPGQCDSWVKSTGYLPTQQWNAISNSASTIAVSLIGN